MYLVDLGCGPPTAWVRSHNVDNAFYIGVDQHSGNEPHIVADIRHPIRKIKPGTVQHVCCNHVIEHLPQEDWRLVLREMARMLIEGGTFEIRVPHPQSESAMMHGHVHVMTPRFWRDIQTGVIALHADTPLMIDHVQEVPNNSCVELCEENELCFEDWSPFLFNAFTETVIRGVKKNADSRQYAR